MKTTWNGVRSRPTRLTRHTVKVQRTFNVQCSIRNRVITYSNHLLHSRVSLFLVIFVNPYASTIYTAGGDDGPSRNCGGELSGSHSAIVNLGATWHPVPTSADRADFLKPRDTHTHTHPHLGFSKLPNGQSTSSAPVIQYPNLVDLFTYSSKDK
jgi:hypothetical protein